MLSRASPAPWGGGAEGRTPTAQKAPQTVPKKPYSPSSCQDWLRAWSPRRATSIWRAAGLGPLGRAIWLGEMVGLGSAGHLRKLWKRKLRWARAAFRCLLVSRGVLARRSGANR